MNQAAFSATTSSPLFTTVIVIIAIWSLVWKGLALWKAAERGQKWWFIIMFVLGTAGILEIIYYFFIAKRTPIIGSK